jgi:hypothetical protein
MITLSLRQPRVPRRRPEGVPRLEPVRLLPRFVFGVASELGVAMDRTYRIAQVVGRAAGGHAGAVSSITTDTDGATETFVTK